MTFVCQSITKRSSPNVVDSFPVLKIMLIYVKILQSTKMSKSFPTFNLKNLRVAFRQNIRKTCPQDSHGC